MKYIKLTQGYRTKVDDADYTWLTKWKWMPKVQSNTLYPYRWVRIGNDKSKKVFMHRFIMGVTDSKMEVDHIDGNGLNNQRKNLRVCTHQQNVYNTKKRKDNKSGYIGVKWQKRDNTWVVYVGHNGKRVFVGYFKNKIEAAKVYDATVSELRGEFAKLNFPKKKTYVRK